MSGLLRIRWAIAPQISPRPHIDCNRCGGVRPFRSSGKFRVNANGKRIDAWLIYRCANCDNSWNFAIFERCNRRDVEPALLAALENNDPALARRHAFDTTALRGRIGRVEEFPDVAVQRHVLEGMPENTTLLDLRLSLEMPVSLRLDRLLAGELGISRSRLQGWQERRLLGIDPDGARALRKPPRDGMGVRIDLSGETDRNTIVAAAGCG